jgi:Raf kinase inhibitor-like YbhB/YbcL family protein
MKVLSKAFREKETIPLKYTCDGDNICPPLEIHEIPKNAESLVIIMDDPDIPDSVKKNLNIEVYDHWVLFNIRLNSFKTGFFEIEEGVEPEGKKGLNSSGKVNYVGPCPPEGQHRYFIKVYALKSFIDLPHGTTKSMIEKNMNGLIIDSAELMAFYERI